jgi:phosphoinositide-3-kinase regulatory subunit 4
VCAAHACTPLQTEIDRIRTRLESNHNSTAVQFTLENDRSGILVRPYFFSNLFDRLSTRPLLNIDEKRWIAFQLLRALAGSHSSDVCHGDIKIDNVLLTSWNWVCLSDYASFKPTALPSDNPAAFVYFFDMCGRGTCAVAPERFYDSAEFGDAESHTCRYEGTCLSVTSGAMHSSTQPPTTSRACTDR